MLAYLSVADSAFRLLASSLSRTDLPDSRRWLIAKIKKARWQLFQALRWASWCLGPNTLSFEIQLEPYVCDLGSPLFSSLTEALSGMADLHNLRCFSFQAQDYSFEDAPWVAAGTFQEWVINHTSRIRALRLLQSKPRLALCAERLQHLKHLEMEAHAFVWGVRQAEQLPSLQTLHLHVDNHARVVINSFIHSLHAFQSVDQVRCSRHSMAALQPALSWDFFHHVYESPAICKSSLT